VERADGPATVEHSGGSEQLGERDFDGHADRPQGHQYSAKVVSCGHRSPDAAQLVTQAWDYFKNVQTRPEAVPLIQPEDTPAIWLNKERMEKFRPEMKKYTTTRRSEDLSRSLGVKC
jgi:hypothetical protein